MSFAKRNSEAARAWAVKRRGSQDKAPFQQQQQQQTHFGGASAELRRPRYCDEGERQPRHAAATSHDANAAYMEEFRKGLGALNLASQGSVGGRFNAKDRAYPNAALGGKTSGYYQPTERQSAERRTYPGLEREGRRSAKHAADLTFLADEYKGHCTGGGGAAVGWCTGPLDPGGQLVDLSDRNLLCASVLGDEAVFGCADHALYCVDLSRGVRTRQLYGSHSKSAAAGHKEWVSTVSHTPHGDIVSGGLDGKLCLWPRDGGVPREVQAHAGSISAMKVDVEARVVTSGYGGALRVWDCRGGRSGWVVAPRKLREVSDPSLSAPCMTFAWCGSQVLTGHRDGRLGLYDLETGQMVSGSSMKQRAHRGHVTTAISAPSFCANREGGPACFVTGGQDGFIRVWDPRVGKLEASEGNSGGLPPAAVMESAAHRSAAGVGAVGEIITPNAGSGGTRLISYGADKRVCVLELRGGKGHASGNQNHRSPARASLAVEHVFNDHREFIYCIDVLPSAAGDVRGSFLVTGGGDGLLLVHDLSSMRLLYGLRCCSAGAVRCAIAGRERLTVAGDDGNAMLYKYEG